MNKNLQGKSHRDDRRGMVEEKSSTTYIDKGLLSNCFLHRLATGSSAAAGGAAGTDKIGEGILLSKRS